MLFFMFNNVLLFLLFLTGCSTTHNGSFLGPIKGEPSLRIKHFPVKNSSEAKNYIQNQLNFLAMLFEQSREPYYGTPRWTEECLKENQIGKIEDNGNGMKAISRLYLDKNGNTGHCSTSFETYHSYVIYLYCSEKDVVMEIKYALTPQNSALPKDLCQGL